MPYYKVTWEVVVRADDEAKAVPRADDLREAGDCKVVKVPDSEVPDAIKASWPELMQRLWPGVNIILANGEVWPGEGPLLEVLDHFLDAGLSLSHVVAIVPTRE